MAHAPDPPNLSGHRAEATADLDAELSQEPPAHPGLVQAVGQAILGDYHRRQLGQPVALLGEQFEAALDEAVLQLVATRLVAGLGVFEALLEHHAEPGVEAVDHGDGRRVVVRPGATAGDVLGDHGKVEVPGLRPLDEAVDGGL